MHRVLSAHGVGCGRVVGPCVVADKKPTMTMTATASAEAAAIRNGCCMRRAEMRSARPRNDVRTGRENSPPANPQASAVTSSVANSDRSNRCAQLGANALPRVVMLFAHRCDDSKRSRRRCAQSSGQA